MCVYSMILKRGGDSLQIYARECLSRKSFGNVIFLINIGPYRLQGPQFCRLVVD